jgi:hypothetical protein
MSVVYVYPKCPAGNSEGHWLSALHRFASVFSKPSILTLELTFFLLSLFFFPFFFLFCCLICFFYSRVLGLPSGHLDRGGPSLAPGFREPGEVLTQHTTACASGDGCCSLPLKLHSRREYSSREGSVVHLPPVTAVIYVFVVAPLCVREVVARCSMPQPPFASPCQPPIQKRSVCWRTYLFFHSIALLLSPFATASSPTSLHDALG